MAFAQPGLAKDWHITDVGVFGPVLAASIIGMMFGSAAFDYWGDKPGRRVVTIAACLVFALFTGPIVFAETLPQLLLLRLLAGVGLGGAAPNAIANVRARASAESLLRRDGDVPPTSDWAARYRGWRPPC